MFRTPSKSLSIMATSALALIAVSSVTGTAIANSTAASLEMSETSVAQTEERATITVNVTGFAQQSGSIMVALSDEATYQNGGAIRGTMAVVDAETVTLTFEQIPAGTYAIRMFHDVDGNGEMNANAFGIPTEPFAFSNNAKAVMGPATWVDAQFEHGSDGSTQTISF
jgi:uncharacterized protein (DUF2141 family)